MIIATEKCEVEPASHEACREIGRVPAGNGDFDVGQLVAQNTHGLREPVHFRPSQKAQGEGVFRRLSGPLRGFRSRIDLGQREARVVVQPGPIDTDLNPASGNCALTQKAATALDRYGRADEVAAMVAFVAGPESAGEIQDGSVAHSVHVEQPGIEGVGSRA